jgi:ATP-dependent Lon protease
MNATEHDLSQKATSVFGSEGILVDKKLSALSDQFKKLPKFVVDYLINGLVDPNNPGEGLAKIDQIMSQNYVESEKRELIKSQIKQNGVHSLLGHIRCRYDQAKDEYWADLGALGDQYVRIDPFIINEHGDTLLTTGAWGTVDIAFDDNYTLKSKRYPFYVIKFVPLQITKINVDEWIDKRNSFTRDEWIDLLVTSVGFDPSAFTFEEKILYLVRLVPFVEANMNMIELGPTETGKTFGYRCLSSYGFVLSGSSTTVASLFYNKLRRKQGIICHRDCVMFDEIGHSNWTGQDDLVNMLKDFMNAGRFGRDTQEFSSDASIVFAGNIDCDRNRKEVKGFYRHLFAVLPPIIANDRAFLDRIHGYIPGWKAPQISEANYAKGVGFMADYLSEIMHQLRSRYYGHIIDNRIDFNSMGQRNQTSTVKIASGLLKLIFPHKTLDTISNDELELVTDIGTSLRQRVVSQLAVISPGEFGGTKLSWDFK